MWHLFMVTKTDVLHLLHIHIIDREDLVPSWICKFSWVDLHRFVDIIFMLCYPFIWWEYIDDFYMTTPMSVVHCLSFLSCKSVSLFVVSVMIWVVSFFCIYMRLPTLLNIIYTVYLILCIYWYSSSMSISVWSIVQILCSPMHIMYFNSWFCISKYSPAFQLPQTSRLALVVSI